MKLKSELAYLEIVLVFSLRERKQNKIKQKWKSHLPVQRNIFGRNSTRFLVLEVQNVSLLHSHPD